MDTIIVSLIVYLAIMFLVAWYFSRRESLDAYFLNKGQTGLWMLTFASVATMIGAGSTVAMVSEIYNSGISYGLAIPISMVVGAILLSVVSKRVKEEGDKYKVCTLVDYFKKRFDTKNHILAFVLQLFLIIIVVGVQAIAIASLATILTGISYGISLFLAAGITILYTAIGGLKIDIITDFIQFWVILIVFIILAILGYIQIGGFENLISSLPEGHLNPFAFGGVIWFLGVVFFSWFMYLGNSAHWQRIISARNKHVARKSFALAVPFFLILGAIIIFFGLIASVLLNGISQDTAIFSLMEILLPPYLVGIGFAAILAVIMSSIDSSLIGGSTIIYKGIFKKHQFDKKSEVLYARLITALFGICGFALAFLIPNIVSLSLFAGYLAITFAIPLIFALYSNKISADANFYSILISTILLIFAFPIIGPNSFLVPLFSNIIILAFYDKIFKKKIPTPLEIIGFEE